MTRLSLYPCRRPIVVILIVAATLLARGAHARRSRLNLPFTQHQISCESILVKANPDNYPHCHCEFGPWSPFRFSSYGSSSTCPSGHKYVLVSTRNRLSTKCTLRPTAQRRTKDVCKWCPQIQYRTKLIHKHCKRKCVNQKYSYKCIM